MTCVKICGITNGPDALLAAAAGADLLGFVFYPPSPRHIRPEQVRRIVQTVRRLRLPVCTVGVFVDKRPEDVLKIARCCGLDYVQLHGREPPSMVKRLRRAGLQVIKAFRVRDDPITRQIERYTASAYLLDAYVPGVPGGSGQGFDWHLAAEAVGRAPIILAGGLSADNVGQAVRTVHPWGVDVSSGVEAAPGKKDPQQLQRFVERAKNAGGPVQEEA